MLTAIRIPRKGMLDVNCIANVLHQHEWQYTCVKCQHDQPAAKVFSMTG